MFNARDMLENLMKDPRYANNARAQNVMKCLRAGDRNGLINMAENISRANGSDFSTDQKKFFDLFKK